MSSSSKANSTFVTEALIIANAVSPQKRNRPELDNACSICTEFLYEPHVTSCGHTFCYNCMIKLTTNNNSQCPTCKCDKPNWIKNILLCKMIEQMYPEEYAISQKIDEEQKISAYPNKMKELYNMTILVNRLSPSQEVEVLTALEAMLEGKSFVNLENFDYSITVRNNHRIVVTDFVAHGQKRTPWLTSGDQTFIFTATWIPKRLDSCKTFKHCTVRTIYS